MQAVCVWGGGRKGMAGGGGVGGLLAGNLAVGVWGGGAFGHTAVHGRHEKSVPGEYSSNSSGPVALSPPLLSQIKWQ